MSRLTALLLLALLPACGGGADCEVDGTTYADGDTFEAPDGCNTCTCDDGAAACTEMACVDSDT
jgi:hypothetical protein